MDHRDPLQNIRSLNSHAPLKACSLLQRGSEQQLKAKSSYYEVWLSNWTRQTFHLSIVPSHLEVGQSATSVNLLLSKVSGRSCLIKAYSGIWVLRKWRPLSLSLSRWDIITTVDWNSEVMAHKSIWSMVTETKLQDTPVPLFSQRTTRDAFQHRCKGDFCWSCVTVSEWGGSCVVFI